MVVKARKSVVIVGGGFGGLYAAKSLAGLDLDLVLLDKTNHHTFQPLLYQVATAGLNPADIAVPIRSILRKQANVTVLMAEAANIDVEKRRVDLGPGYDGDTESLSYDFLIIATGVTHSYFGHSEFARLAPGLKTIDEGLLIRQRIFMAYEAAERESDPDVREALLTFVVIGAGPTGVEMAGALAEIAKNTLAKEFRRIDPTSARVILLEGGDRVLPSYPPALSDKARHSLKKLGVELRENTLVTNIDDDCVFVGEARIPTKTVVWAAGVQASPLARSLGAPLDKAGRVLVTPELSIPGHDEVYVIGDLASFVEDGTSVPGVAPAAIQEARHAVKNIRAAIAGRARTRFHYVDKGSLATIGRAAAVADLGFAKLSGFIAWLAWFGIHVFFLIGFRNRFLVIFQWAWSYFTFDRGSRLIHGMVTPKRADAPSLPMSQRKPPTTEDPAIRVPEASAEPAPPLVEVAGG